MKKRTLLLLLPMLFLVALGLSAAAAEPAATGPETWNARLQQSEGLLVAGEYAAAYEVTGPLLAEVGGQLLASEQSNRVLGSLFAVQALAEAGTGRDELAAWHWSVAESLKPELATMSLEPYGEAGERIGEWMANESERCGGITLPELRASQGAEASIEKIESPWPQYSPEMRRVGLEGQVILKAVIDYDGRLRCPELLDFDQPAFAFIVAETLPRWSYEPILVDGEPTRLLHNLTFKFSFDD